jgi:hypothetical protein
VAYIIWYGNWPAADKDIVLNFVNNVGSSAWWAMNNDYLVSKLTFGAAITDAYSLGKSLTPDSANAIAQNALEKGLLPKNTNGIYLVMTSR